jgi:hypothetical protein
MSSTQKEPIHPDSATARQERAFVAAAHREGRSDEERLESAQKAAEIHKQRTGHKAKGALYNV